MKVHFIREYFYTGKRQTHFKTICGKIRHVYTNLPTTEYKNAITCKICAMKKETSKELSFFDKIKKTEERKYCDTCRFFTHGYSPLCDKCIEENKHQEMKS